jgi:hypothetical protein
MKNLNLSSSRGWTDVGARSELCGLHAETLGISVRRLLSTRSCRVLVVIVLSYFALMLPCPGQSETIDIPDRGLRAALNSVLGKPIDSEITRAQLEAVTSLTLRPHVIDRDDECDDDLDIRNLEGLQHATLLETLQIRSINRYTP